MRLDYRRVLYCVGLLCYWLTTSAANTGQLHQGRHRPSLAVDQILSRTTNIASGKLLIEQLVDRSINKKAVAQTLNQMTATVATMAGPGASATRKTGMLRRFLYDPGPWNDNGAVRQTLKVSASDAGGAKPHSRSDPSDR
jgi:hypothetical protein